MATTYRTERDILTIPVDVLPDKLTEGVDPEKSRVIKISAYPAVWRWLREKMNDRQELDRIIDQAIRDAHDKIPLPRTKLKDIGKNDFDGAFEHLANVDGKKSKGTHYRGNQKKKSDITSEMKEIAPWLRWFFGFWKERPRRPDWVQLIYNKRRDTMGQATKDPIDMTYFCCLELYKEKLESRGESFPRPASFRTTYLAGKRITRRSTEDDIVKYREKHQHPLNVLADVCRKLQE